MITLTGKQLEQRSVAGRPFRVVLAGRTNAGKSSLFNALAGSRKALVSPEPGTTRDYLVHRLHVGGVTIELMDTAGLSAPVTDVDTRSQDLGQAEASRADLVVWCAEAPGTDSQPPEFTQATVLTIVTKCDLAEPRTAVPGTSALTGRGVSELRTMLGERARAHFQPSIAPSLSRCRQHVDTCLAHLRRAHAEVLEDAFPELIALELRNTIEELGAMVGAVYTDDLLDRIFSRFCIGK
jgi:tRNA modification GTPase